MLEDQQRPCKKGECSDGDGRGRNDGDGGGWEQGKGPSGGKFVFGSGGGQERSGEP